MAGIHCPDLSAHHLLGSASLYSFHKTKPGYPASHIRQRLIHLVEANLNLFSSALNYAVDDLGIPDLNGCPIDQAFKFDGAHMRKGGTGAKQQHLLVRGLSTPTGSVIFAVAATLQDRIPFQQFLIAPYRLLTACSKKER
jgi:hypothetical protein